MLAFRIIPRLDIKGPNLVKGVRLEGLRVLGRPEHFARHYYERGADELLYLDAVASLYHRNGLTEIIERTARDIAIPLTVGGGLRSLRDVREALLAGADKTAINTAALARPALIREAARRFGSSTIVVSIDAVRHPDGRYECVTDGGRNRTGIDACAWALQAAELGAGELLVTSVDREGTGMGYDLELTRRIAASVPIPVVASGGAGCVQHLHDAATKGQADAVAVASCLHYEGLRHHRPARDDFAAEGNREFLRRPTPCRRVQEMSLETIKTYLIEQGVACRPSDAPLMPALE